MKVQIITLLEANTEEFLHELRADEDVLRHKRH